MQQQINETSEKGKDGSTVARCDVKFLNKIT